MSETENCVFCKIVAGEIPSRKVDEDELSFSFLDIEPFHRGHTLVIPKRHSESLISDPPALGELAPAIDRVSRMLVQKLGAEGLNLLTSAGSVAGQEVFHFHVHLVPRYPSAAGLADFLTSKAPATAEELDAVQQELTGS